MSLLKNFNPKQRKIMILMFFASVILSISAFVFDYFQSESFLEILIRPDSFEEEKEVTLDIRYEGEGRDENLEYTGILGRRRLTEEEAKRSMKEAFSFVEETMFREGEDKDNVSTGLTIPDNLEGNPVNLSWEAEDGELFLANGDIDSDKVGMETKKTKIVVKAEYGEIEEEREYEIKILPIKLSAEEERRRKIRKELDKALESSKEKEVILPKKILEQEVTYVSPKNEIAPFLTGMSILSVFVGYFYFKNSNDKKKEKRERELKAAYPYFVGRFVILLGAGLNILGIWKKFLEAENFNESLSEEIKITLWEIGNGKTEREAYENFGKRIGGMQYQKFVSILTENLKMGSSQILVRLGTEAREAMLDRKNHAREIGETMGTKLLFPMMLELVLIMLIIMIPAMMAARG